MAKQRKSGKHIPGTSSGRAVTQIRNKGRERATRIDWKNALVTFALGTVSNYIVLVFPIHSSSTTPQPEPKIMYVQQGRQTDGWFGLAPSGGRLS